MKKHLPVNLNIGLKSECWNFIRLAILLNDDYYMPWYIERFNNYFVDETFSFHYYEWNTMEFYTNYDEVLQFQDIEDKSEIIKVIIDVINTGDYVTLYWDRYYVKGTLQYQKEHKVHGILVYGYDTDRETINFVDNEINGKLWGGYEISYEELKCAFKSGVDIVAKNPEKWHWIYQINLPASIIHLRKDFTRTVRPEAFYTAVQKNLAGGELKDISDKHAEHCSVKRYGIHVYKSYYNDLYKILKHENNNYCNEEGNEFIFYKLKAFIECKKCFAEKLEYFNEKGIIIFSDNTINKAKQVYEMVNKSYLLLSKYTFGFKMEILERAREQLMKAQESDIEILSEVKDILEEQYMFKKLDFISCGQRRVD